VATTYDLAAFNDLGNGQPAAQFLADNKGGTLIFGSTKLGQRVALELLTEAGSLPFATTRGTLFITYLRTGALTEMDVLVAFAAARLALRSNLQNEETDDDPPDERFLDAVVDRVVVTQGSVSLVVSVSSRAGLVEVLVLPVMIFEYS